MIDKSGSADICRQNIIAQALSRTLQIAVLFDVERRFQVGEIQLGVYVLWNLTNTLYARPESLRQVRCGDLTYKKDSDTGEIQYTLWVMPAKRAGKRMLYSLTSTLGLLLVKQQAWVIENTGPLYGMKKDLDPVQRKVIEQQLALFPRINAGMRNDFEVKHFGMLKDGSDFITNYLLPIKRGLDNINVNFTVMRHTVGTQLAAAGVSAAVIQAVLRHATDRTARVYIDLAAKELREALNNGLEALEELFPAYNAFINADQTRAMAQQFP
jgi:integrase